MKVLLIDQIAKVNYKYSYSLANALAKKENVQIDLVIDGKEQDEKCSLKKYRLFNTADKDIGKLKKVINYLKSVHKILQIAKDGYDIIHSQWIIFSPVDYWCLKELKKQGEKIVLTVHDILPFNQKFYDYYYHKKIYGLADRIIVQAPDNVERFHTLFPKNEVPVSMIPHGHFMDYVEKQNFETSRERLGLSPDKFVFLFFGQIKKVKGVDTLLEAWAKLLKEQPELKEKAILVIAGSVWKSDFGKCTDIIKKKNLEEYLKLDIRYIPDEEVDYYYGAADVCVLPYYEVYQSGVLQLTYAQEKPAIVTDIPAFTDIVDESCGFICKPGDIESLVKAMGKAYVNRERLPEMAKEGYECISKRFDWNRIADEIARVYQI